MVPLFILYGLNILFDTSLLDSMIKNIEPKICMTKLRFGLFYNLYISEENIIKNIIQTHLL